MLLFFAAAALVAPGIDAPVVPKQPTIRSEIRRGMDAASNCHEMDLLEHVHRYENCIEAAQNANRQRMGSAFEAFDVGLYRVARDIVADAAEVVTHSPASQFDPTLFKAVLAVEEAGYQQSRKALKLSEAEIDRAVTAP